jgi:uncharacterized small protein (DUF1192 family)
MNEYDQERFSEVCEELDAAKERIKCLEAEIADLKAELKVRRLELKGFTTYDH